MPSIRKKPDLPKRERKTQRLELRLAPSAKKVIQQAMSVTGLAAGDLAYEGARRLLDEHQRMVLAGADRDAFLAAIEREPDPARVSSRRSSGIAICLADDYRGLPLIPAKAGTQKERRTGWVPAFPPPSRGGKSG
jgi:uncharacterized protein (DUF1778 family)